MKIQNFVVNHESRPVKSNPGWSLFFITTLQKMQDQIILFKLTFIFFVCFVFEDVRSTTLQLNLNNLWIYQLLDQLNRIPHPQ